MGTAVERLVEAMAALAPVPASVVLGAAVADRGRGDDGTLTRPAGHEHERFEIGSITKTMTATVLAWMVLGGELDLDDPIGRWLDAGPEHGTITLGQLATHTSGLPRLAPNHRTYGGYDPADPYAGFTAGHAEAGLREVAERTTAGGYAYSNFGYQLLGVCLERANGDTPLPELLRRIVFEPLGLDGATADLDDERVPLIQGTGGRGEPVPPWRLPLAGPGAVRATLADLVAYGRAVADPPPGRLGDAIRLAVEPRADGPGGRVGLGWLLHPSGLVLHGGGTAGCSSQLVVAPDDGRVVAAFVATGGFDGLQSLAVLAGRGEDPMDAVPQPIEEGVDTSRWTATAVAVAAALDAGDFDAVRAHGTESLANALTDERLAAARDARIGPLGDSRTPPVVRSVGRKGQRVEVVVTTGVDTIVTIDADGRVAGLLLR